MEMYTLITLMVTVVDLVGDNGVVHVIDAYYFHQLHQIQFMI